MSASGSHRGSWIALAVITLIEIAAQTVLWTGPDSVGSRGRQALSGYFVVVGILLALPWVTVVLGSWTRRIALWLVLAVAIGGSLTMFEFVGMSGDLVPQFRWRGTEPEWTEAGAFDPSTLRDYPQFLGPNRDGCIADLQLARDWTLSPPEEIWRRPMGVGWSGFSVSGTRAVTQEQLGEEERVVCLAIETGEVLWVDAVDRPYISGIAGDGPRATPTIIDGTVYTCGATGIVTALDLETGERRWQVDLVERFGQAAPEWGATCSPLIIGDTIIVEPGADGASMVALSRADGSVQWQTGDDRAGYSSPTLLEVAGAPQLVMFQDDAVTGRNPDDGEVLWRYGIDAIFESVVPPILVGENRVLAAAGYGVGGALLEISELEDGSFQAKPVWKSRHLKAKYCNLLLIDDHVYTLDDATMACVELNHGRRVWKDGRFGHGQLLHVGDLVLIQTEEGELVLIEPSTDGLKILSRYPVFEERTWNVPALAGDYLLMRNDRQAALLRLPTAGGD